MKGFLPNKKGFFALLLALFLSSGTAYAYSFSKTISGTTFYFNITNSTQHYVEITYPGTSSTNPWGGTAKPTGSITLPSTVTYNSVTYTVTKIGDYAFYECDGLTGTLTIPNTVNTIGVNAFNGCSGFTGSLTIPNSVTTIDWQAFADCSGFDGTLTLPNSLTTIGFGAFGWCPNFTGSLTIPNSVTSMGDFAFYLDSGFTGSLTIGNSVPSIGEYAFSSCGFTGSLTIGNSVTSIGKSAFHACHGFTGSLVIPNSVTTIDEWAFYACDGMTGTLTLGNSLTTIGDRAFWDNRFTGSLTIPNSVTTIGELAFGYNLGLNGTLTIGTGVTSIGESAFKSCSGFKGSLTIPNSVTEIGETAFSGCSGFTGDLTIGKNVASIGIDAFKNCTGFTHLNYNAINCAGIEYEDNDHTPFKDLSGTLSIGDEVQRIPESMFYYCSGFTGSLTIPDSVTEIAYSAFHSCYGFTGWPLYLGNALTTIGVYAFYGCNFTGSLTIPDSVTEIGYCAFYGSHFTVSLTIGSNVNSIGGSAFTCSGMTSMIVRAETPPTLETNAFQNAPSNLPVYVPCGTLSAYQNASGWNAFTNMTAYCDPLTYSINPDGISVTVTGHQDGLNATGALIIPETKTLNGVTYTVTAIGEAAFSGCSGLTGDLVIPNTVTSIGRYAFQLCNGFTGTLTLPNNLTTLSDGAFYLCSGFTGNLNLPNSLTVISKDAFATCSGFTGPLTIPNTVTSIGELAFHNCSGFTGSLTIPDAVTTIGRQAFANCSGFTGPLTIPNSVTTIGEEAFWQCFGLNGTLTIGTSVASMGEKAFGSCSFTHINYNVANCDGYDQYDVSPFISLNATLTIGNTVQVIPYLMFSKCTGLTGTLTIPTSVTTIEYGAFYECSGFTGSLNIPNSVTSIGGSAFLACSGFNGTLTLPSSLTKIEDRTFRNCRGFIGSLTIPDGVTSIGFEAFLGCYGFTGTLSIGDAVTTIDNYAFSFCYHFTGSLTIPNAVTEIGECAFQDCSDFTGNLNINGPVTSIGGYAFNYCRGLTGQLTLPSTVTEIGEMAFNFCDHLTSITALPATPPTLGENAFQNVPTGIPVYVPCGSLSAYEAAEGWSSFTNLQCAPWTVTLSVTPYGSGAVMGEGSYANGAPCTVTAIPNNLWLFMHWSKNGTVISTNLSYSFNVYEDTDLEAVFMALSDAGDIIGTGTNTSTYFPSHSLYNYSLTEQIYTSTELEGITTITSISFFNAGAERTRLYDVYLVNTDKASFTGGTDWIPVYQADCVFTGYVTMRRGMWTTIVLDTPFSYDGNSNLALVVDDNTGTWEGSMSCRTYTASGNQAIRIYSDGTNYNPSSPLSYTGTPMSVKNQIMLNRLGYNIAATSANETAGTVSGGGTYGQGDLCQLKATANTGYTFLSWSNTNGTVVSTEAEYSFFVTENRTLVANFLTGTDVCSLTFDLEDSYGDGWNGNYLVVDFGDGLSQRLAVPSGKYSATYTLPVTNGSHVELSWVKGAYTYECSFEVRYSNDNLVCTSDGQVLDGNFEFGFDMDCAEMPALWVYVGDGGNVTNNYLPSYSYYNYGLSQQIYTAAEIGMAGNITSIAFYNKKEEEGDDNTKTRTYDIYLKATNKYEFYSNADWISVSEGDKVFSGSVTMVSNQWTTINLDMPFIYDGTSNIVLVMDDNTGDYTTAPHMDCRVFTADGNQAIRTYGDLTNYDPSNPPINNGTLVAVKNQVYFGFTPSVDCWRPGLLTATDITSNSATLNWIGEQDSYKVRYRTIPSFYEEFEDEETFDDDWTFISMNAANAIGAGDKAAGLHTTAAYNGDYGFRFSSYSRKTDAETYDQYLISPQLTVTGELRFYFKKYNTSTETFYVGYSTTGNDIENDFTWTNNLAPTEDWQEYTQQLPADVKYIAFHYFGNYTFYVYLDDISIDGNGIPIGNWNTVNNVAGTTTEITGLESSTLYEWQVQGNNTICNDGVTDWSEKDTFTTKCTAFLVDADNPFFEDFEGTTFAPDCWETFSTGILQWTRTTNYSHSSSHSAYSSYYGDNYLVLPDLELPANASAAQLDFWSYNAYPNGFIAGNNTVVLLDGDDETVLWSALSVCAAWEKTTVDLTPYLGQTITLAFKYAGSNSNRWYLDDVEVSVTPVTTVTQTIELAAGTNWVSFNVEITLDDLKAALVATGYAPITIQSKNDGLTTYNGTRWRGSLSTLDVAQMYMVTVETACEIELEGAPVNPADHPVIIHNGANWIAFPLSESMTITNAFAGFNVVSGDVVNSKSNGLATYTNRWRGTLTTLVPGQGYIYNSAATEDRVLTFPTSAK